MKILFAGFRSAGKQICLSLDRGRLAISPPFQTCLAKLIISEKEMINWLQMLSTQNSWTIS